MQTFLDAFPTRLALLDPLSERLAKAPVDADAQKRLKRARMLHMVVTSKVAAVKLSDLKTMTSEWIHGMLEATFPVESDIVDGEFAAADRSALKAVLATLDGAHICARQLAALYREAGELQPKTPMAGGTDASGDDPPPVIEAGGCTSADVPTRPTEEEAAQLVRSALSRGTPLRDVAAAGVDEVLVFGADLWEALLWRRGALRFYMASTAVKARLSALVRTVHSTSGTVHSTDSHSTDGTVYSISDGDDAVKVAAGAAASIVASALAAVDISEGVIGNVGVGSGSGGGGGGGGGSGSPRAGEADDSPRAGEADDGGAAVINQRAGAAAASCVALLEETHGALSLLLTARRDPSQPEEAAEGATQLRYGVYSSTHLLALAFLGEVCYWRWAAADHEALVSPSTAAGSAAALWYGRAAVCVHRYLHTVSILMEGCGWSVAKLRELSELLQAGRADAFAHALESEVGVPETEAALRKAAKDEEAAKAAAITRVPTGESKSKSGKKGKGGRS